MKYFKSIFVILLLLFSLSAKSQASYDFSYDYSWKLSGKAYCGVGNAYCIVMRSPELNIYGTYTYHIYFSTNSFFTDCTPARTYIPDIEVFYFDTSSGTWIYPSNYYKFWITVGKQTLTYTLFHPDPSLKIKINVGYMTPTTY